MLREQNSTLTDTISHTETIRNTVTSFNSHLLMLIQIIAQNHNQIQRNMSINKFLSSCPLTNFVESLTNIKKYYIKQSRKTFIRFNKFR